MAENRFARRRPSRRTYDVTQCAFYKLESKGRLCYLLGLTRGEIASLSLDQGNYREFERPEETCEFTSKVTKARLIQEPIGDLKNVQARIASLLARVSLPSYCQGAAKGFSYRTNAAAHEDADAVATFDVRKFFPSTPQSRVYSFFRSDLLCSHDVAELLAALLCFKGSLPTGAPSSPIVSFYANRQLFSELADLAVDLDLIFTAYIDDLTFSGKAIPASLANRVQHIVEKSGHQLSESKSRVFGIGVPKHVTGTVIHNGKLSVPHSRFRKARAIMTARDAAVDPNEKVRLSRKLAGLLGEAAYLDARFSELARRSYETLAADLALVE